MEIFDISPKISEDLAVFPGDTPFSRQVAMAFSSGHHLGLSSISSTVHIGAHADAPSHYHKEGEAIDEVDLLPYVGPAEVIKVEATGPQGRIQLSDLGQFRPKTARLLFRTDSFTEPKTWREDFSSLSPEVIEYCHGCGVQLVGIDTPSVDPSTSKTLESHQALYRTKMRVLEGLVLIEIEEGPYFLTAAPLKIAGADAAPLRALLLKFTEAEYASFAGLGIVEDSAK